MSEIAKFQPRETLKYITDESRKTFLAQLVVAKDSLQATHQNTTAEISSKSKTSLTTLEQRNDSQA